MSVDAKSHEALSQRLEELLEVETFPPPEEFARDALFNDPAIYQEAADAQTGQPLDLSSLPDRGDRAAPGRARSRHPAGLRAGRPARRAVGRLEAAGCARPVRASQRLRPAQQLPARTRRLDAELHQLGQHTAHQPHGLPDRVAGPANPRHRRPRRPGPARPTPTGSAFRRRRDGRVVECQGDGTEVPGRRRHSRATGSGARRCLPRPGPGRGNS